MRRDTSKRERKREELTRKKRERRENNYSVIVTTTNQNTYTFIHTDIRTRVYHFFKLLDPVHVRELLIFEKRMPADRFAPYPLPSHISHSEYRKVKKRKMID
jgi:hypothetical protein